MYKLLYIILRYIGKEIPMRSALKVLKEQIDYFYLIRRLSLYELKSKNQNNYLGIAWEIINPCIQILIYWFVFGTLRDRAPIEIGGEAVPFFSWLLAGFFLWIFCYQSIIQGSRSIYSRLRMLSKMNFPMSVIPNYVIFSHFYVHLITLVISIILLLFICFFAYFFFFDFFFFFFVFYFYVNLSILVISIILLQFMGVFANISYLQFIYFMFAAFSLLFAISLITSTISTIIRDVHMFLTSTLRMLLYVSGVLWPISRL